MQHNTVKTPQSVEKNLQKILDEYGVSKKLTVTMVKDWIWDDEGESAMDASNRFQKKWFKYFAHRWERDEFDRILQAFVDAWNYFSHKSLKGKSPNEMVQKALKENPKLKKGASQKMPDIIVGGRKMSWDIYWAMIAGMEKLQTPFKQWVEKDLLPKYEEFLKTSLGDKTVEKHMMVADMFFERAMHVGFITFEEIRKDFIQKEFPKWWPTHVLMDDRDEREVLYSLKKLFQFISFFYGRSIARFGF